jgi:hypothetical protein
MQPATEAAHSQRGNEISDRRRRAILSGLERLAFAIVPQIWHLRCRLLNPIVAD